MSELIVIILKISIILVINLIVFIYSALSADLITNVAGFLIFMVDLLPFIILLTQFKLMLYEEGLQNYIFFKIFVLYSFYINIFIIFFLFIELIYLFLIA